MQVPVEAVEERLERWPVARLATLGPDGPHLVPIVFARAAGALWSPVDGKPKAGGELARVRHVRRDPRVSLLLDEYTDRWQELWWVRVDALARVVRPADPTRDADVAAAVAALRAKYPHYERLPMLPAPPTLLRLEPRRIASWCADRGAPLRA